MPNINTLKTSVTEIATLALGALAAKDLTSVAGPVMTRGGVIISSTIAAVISDPDEGDGPYVLGLAANGLTGTEIEEFLEIGGPVSPGDKVAMEKASRGQWIRTLGMLGPQNALFLSSTSLFLKNESIRLRFTEESAGWQWWIYNLSDAALVAGSSLQILGRHFVEFNKGG